MTPTKPLLPRDGQPIEAKIDCNNGYFILCYVVSANSYAGSLHLTVEGGDRWSSVRAVHEFNEPSPALREFIEVAERHFKPVRVLDMTVTEFNDLIVAYGNATGDTEGVGDRKKFKEIALSHGFAFKDGEG